MAARVKLLTSGPYCCSLSGINIYRFQHKCMASYLETLDLCQYGWTYDRKWCGYDAPEVFSDGAQCVSDEAPHRFESVNSHLPFHSNNGGDMVQSGRDYKSCKPRGRSWLWAETAVVIKAAVIDLASSVTNKLSLDIGAGTTLKSADNMIEITRMLSTLSANDLVNKIEIDSTMATSWATSAMVESQLKQSEILSSAIYPAMLIIVDSKTLAVCKVIFHITDDVFATLRNTALLRIAAYPQNGESTFPLLGGNSNTNYNAGDGNKSPRRSAVLDLVCYPFTAT